MSLRVAELETLFTADIRQFDAKATTVENRQKELDGKRAELRVDANITGAVSDLSRIESDARSLPDGEFEVDADTSPAQRRLGDLEQDAKESGERGGEEAGGGLSGGIVAALATIPIAGAVIGIGVAAGAALAKAVQDGFAVEVRADRLMATTGLDPVTVGKLGRAAGDAYGNNWGESLEANFATARQAVQAGLLDPDSTKRDAQSVIESLSGVADIIEDDIGKTARATTTLMRNGLAATAQDAFDIIVKGQQAGLNVSEDWLDTINEYSVLWARLGLTAPQAMGLMQQAIQGGARDTDKAADALKEFQIRATDGSKLSAEGFKILGLNAKEMTEQIAQGGQGAADGLAIVLEKLRAIEDPVQRNAAAVALFGTQAEDLGDALYKMDLSSAVEQLGTVEGAAGKAMSALTDNAQNDIDTAKRNIEVAADGIKGALAGAFQEPLSDFAGWVTENRAGIMTFLLDIANGAFDIGRGFINGIAGATEAVGDFIAGPAVGMVDAIISILNGLNAIPWVDMSGPIESMEGLADNMREADDVAGAMADTMRDKLITNGLDPMQDKLNEVGDQLIWEAEVHDAQVRLAKDIDNLGVASDGTEAKVSLLNGKLDLSTESGKLVAGQMRDVAESMREQAQKAIDAGESNDEMTRSLDESYEALLNQLEAMGFTREEAKALAEQYGAVPANVKTKVSFDDANARSRLATFKELLKIPDVVVTAKMRTEGGYYANRATGSIDVKRMAPGGVLSPVAQMVPPGTERIVGDRMDVDEAFIPLDGSRRSWKILEEAIARMPGGGQGQGFPAPPGGGGDTYQFGNMVFQEHEIPPEMIEFFRTIRGRAKRWKG